MRILSIASVLAMAIFFACGTLYAQRVQTAIENADRFTRQVAENAQERASEEARRGSSGYIEWEGSSFVSNPFGDGQDSQRQGGEEQERVAR